MDEKCQFLSLHASYLPIQVLKTSLKGVGDCQNLVWTRPHVHMPTGAPAVKSKGKTLKNFVAFSKFLNFKYSVEQKWQKKKIGQMKIDLYIQNVEYIQVCSIR